MRDTIDMAREAELNVGPAGMGQTVWGSDTNLKRFEALVRADERKNFCAALRQMHDAYSLASDPAGLKVRRNT